MLRKYLLFCAFAGMVALAILSLEQVFGQTESAERGAKSSQTGQSATAKIDILTARAKAGDADAQESLGRALVIGDGVSVDTTQAAYWVCKAADQGYAKAQFDLGIFYLWGLGHVVPQDPAQAVAFFGKAADQGSVEAQVELGEIYRTGLGVPQDYAQAAGWYRKAAERGDAKAQSIIGRMYFTGVGVAKDNSQALNWLRKAAEQCDALAQSQLSGMYLVGAGMKKRNYAEAYFWASLALAGKLEKSQEAEAEYNLSQSATQQTTKEMEGVVKRCERWIKEHSCAAAIAKARGIKPSALHQTGK